MGYYYSYSAEYRERQRRQIRITIAIIAAVAILVGVGTWMYLRTRSAAYKVTAAQWVAITNVRQKMQRHKADWGQPNESSAFNVKNGESETSH